MPASDASAVPDATGVTWAGHLIVGSSWAGDVVFAVTAVPVALGVEAFDVPAVIVALVLFLGSLVVWVWAFAVAIARTTRGDDVTVTTWFLLEGRVPARPRWWLYGSLAACVAITVGTAAANPFGVLVPMFPLGCVGLWGARHGVFPPRREHSAR